jgi:KDO2-lipid IV(A) lauroyltransferase
VVAVLGHYCNWEWLICIPLFTKFKVVTIFKPLKNKHFNEFMSDIRSRCGIILTPMSQVVREVIDKRKNNIRTLFTFGTDQTPPRGDIKFWTMFLNQDTPVYLGAEKIAAKYNMPVVCFNIQKIRRGFYTVTSEILFEHTTDLPEHLITETHVKKLEEIILEKPEFWLWSHRRWKHKREHADG